MGFFFLRNGSTYRTFWQRTKLTLWTNYPLMSDLISRSDYPAREVKLRKLCHKPLEPLPPVLTAVLQSVLK